MGKNNPNFKYTIENNSSTIIDLSVTLCEKDLGVHIDPLLNFDQHITSMIKLARSLSGLIIRNITYKSKDIMIPLFKSIVRPLLENAGLVWQPYKRKYIDLI